MGLLCHAIPVTCRYQLLGRPPVKLVVPHGFGRGYDCPIVYEVASPSARAVCFQTVDLRGHVHVWQGCLW